MADITVLNAQLDQATKELAEINLKISQATTASAAELASQIARLNTQGIIKQSQINLLNSQISDASNPPADPPSDS